MTSTRGDKTGGQVPLVAVIMPAYNSEDSIVRAIESVRRQTMTDWTLTIVDDGSTDSTTETVSRYVAQHSATNIHLESLANNVGVAEARNVGIAKSESTWIAFFDADDEMEPNHLATMFEHASRESDIDMVLCGRTVVLANETESLQHSSALGTFDGTTAARLTLSDLLTPFPWDRLIRRTLFDGSGFPKGAVRCEDSMTNVVLCSRARQVTSIPDSGIRYYVSGGSITWGKIYSLDDTRIAWDYMYANIPAALKKGRFAHALNNARASMALTIAQTAMLRDGADVPRERRELVSAVVAECRAHIRIRDIVGGLIVNPKTGTASALMKFLPAVYEWLYRRYVRATYAVGS